MTPSPPAAVESSLLHRILVLSDEAAKLPPLVVGALIVANSLLIGLVWDARAPGAPALAAGLWVLAAGLLNWGLLALLPRMGRSFGSPLPPALALGWLLTIGALALALLLPSLAVLAAWLAGVTAIAAYTTWIAPFRLAVTHETLAGSGLTAPLRVVHIGDLHIERITARERALNARLHELNPDLIVFSGDFVNLTYRNDPRAEADVRAVISAWHAPCGVFAVPGTPIVEPLPRVMAFVHGLSNLTLLLNRWQTVTTPAGPLQIAGLVTTHDLPADRAALAALTRSAPETRPRLLLTHSPDVAPEAAAAGFDLMLCGHTHGGQIVLPLLGPLFSGSAYGRRFIRGRYRLGKMALYVTRGLGMEGWGAPRARWFCPPEITVWTLQPEANLNG